MFRKMGIRGDCFWSFFYADSNELLLVSKASTLTEMLMDCEKYKNIILNSHAQNNINQLCFNISIMIFRNIMGF